MDTSDQLTEQDIEQLKEDHAREDAEQADRAYNEDNPYNDND